jgi:predicted regulator of Ras-like GTPase activity (Roadblock/LC7/MglB family)
MDAAQALADLTEISSQIEAAVLTTGDGSVLASTFSDPARGERVASLAHQLVSSAEEVRSDLGREQLVQLEVATPTGSVFFARDADRMVAAVTGSQPTVGLVFYDLKTCLRLLAQDEQRPSETAADDA